MENTWSVGVKSVTPEDNAAAIFACLRASAWGTYSAMRFAVKAIAGEDLNEGQRADWVRMSFEQVIGCLPPDSPYRELLKKFLDENLEQMIR
jgi:hypothetical protein